MKRALLALFLFACVDQPPPPCGPCSSVTVGGSMVVACRCETTKQ